MAGDSFLSVDNPEMLQNKTLLFPNPVQNMLHSNTIMKSVKITDLTGKTMAQFNDTNKIDFSAFENAIYVITIQKENGISETRKIIKE